MNLTILKELDSSQKCARLFLVFIVLFTFSEAFETEDCWGQPLHDASHSAHVDSEICVPLSVSQEFVLHGAEFIWGHPVMSGDYILITSFRLLKYPEGFYLDKYATNKVYCFSVQSGEEVWTLDVGDVDCSPLISGKKVLMPADTLQCYNIETGELLWEKDIKAEFMPTLDGDTAYIVASEPDPGVYAVKICNGEFWGIDRNAGSTYTYGGYIAVADNTLYLPYSTDAEWGILAMDSYTGEILWKTTNHPYLASHHKVISCDEENLYFVSASFELLALNKETGELLWTFGEDLSLFPELSSDDSHIYTYSRSTTSVWCIDKKTGDAVWSEPVFPEEVTDSLILHKFLVSSKNFVFISQCPIYAYPKSGYMYGSCEFFIHALDKRTGALVWTSRAFGFPPGPFALCRNSLVVGSGSKVFVLRQHQEETGESPPPETMLPMYPVLIGILMGIFVVWYLVRKRRSQP